MRFSVSVLVLFAAAGAAIGQTTRPALLIASDFDVLSPQYVVDTDTEPNPISAFGPPVTAPDGTVGFMVRARDVESFVSVATVWRGSGPFFYDVNAPAGVVLSGFESSMGVGGGGRWVYSPSVSLNGDNSSDGVWSSSGLIIRGRDPAPGIPGRFVRANSRPSMFGESGFGFVSTTALTPSGGSASGRAVYKGDLAAGTGLTLVLQTGDTVAGKVVSTASPSISFTYDFSDNGLNHIHRLGVFDGVTTLDSVYFNGSLLAVQGEPLDPQSPFETWTLFRSVTTNDSGAWAFSGQLGGSADALLVSPGVIAAREGDFWGEVPLFPPANCRAVSLNNLGVCAAVWSHVDITFTPRTSLLVFSIDNPAAPRLVVSSGDGLDFDGDQNADAVVTEITSNNALDIAIDLSDHQFVYVKVKMETPPLSGIIEEAIVRFDFPGFSDCPVCAADFNSDDGVDDLDIAAFFAAFEAGESCADVNGDDGIDDLDISFFFAAFEQGC